MQLEVWRDPPLGTAAVYEAIAEQLGEDPAASEPLKRTGLDAMWADNSRLKNPANKTRASLLRRAGAAIKEIVVRRG